MSLLLVDDSPAQRLALSGLLEEAGYSPPHLAGSAAEALAFLEVQPAGAVDLVLMDLHMPQVDGIEACRRIKMLPAWSDLPVIMVTSSAETDDLKLAFAAGAMDYITKPPDEVELLARVQSALQLKREMDERRAREQELRQVNQRLERVLADLDEKHRLLELEQEKSERLLLNILPRPVAARLKEGPGVIAEHFAEVTVLFADLVGFTPLSARMDPEKLVELLNEVFSLFDELAEKHGLEKIKTIGDSYMAVGGLPVPRTDHAETVAEMALDIQQRLAELAGGGLQVRVGIHSGPVVAGVIGRRKFSYDLWGDTVNIASRMEAHGVSGGIQVTAATYARLKDEYEFAERGVIPVKGKGTMLTYMLVGRKTLGLESAGPGLERSCEAVFSTT